MVTEPLYRLSLINNWLELSWYELSFHSFGRIANIGSGSGGPK
jgi:hypothetical protein